MFTKYLLVSLFLAVVVIIIPFSVANENSTYKYLNHVEEQAILGEQKLPKRAPSLRERGSLTIKAFNPRPPTLAGRPPPPEIPPFDSDLYHVAEQEQNLPPRSSSFRKRGSFTNKAINPRPPILRGRPPPPGPPESLAVKYFSNKAINPRPPILRGRPPPPGPPELLAVKKFTKKAINPRPPILRGQPPPPGPPELLAVEKFTKKAINPRPPILRGRPPPPGPPESLAVKKFSNKAINPRPPILRGRPPPPGPPESLAVKKFNAESTTRSVHPEWKIEWLKRKRPSPYSSYHD